jgi:serralysin
MNSYTVVLAALVILSSTSCLFQFSFLGIVVADNIVCTDTSLCIATNMSDIIMDDSLSNQTIYGLNGTDTLIGSKGNDSLGGGERMDQIIGGGGDDTLSGGNGSDEIMGSTGADHISGGQGADEIMGGEGNDTIYGDEGPDAIMGGLSNDAIVGGIGSDSMNGQEGNDKIYQGDLNSTASDGSQDIFYCGDGNDEAWINLDTDKDQPSADCEIIYKG